MANEPTNPSLPLAPSDYVRIEAAALTALAQRLDTTMLAPFTQAIDRILASQSEKSSRVITTGIGKSGIIARKLAATLRSTGTPAHFLHPAEAVHGDIGLIAPGDTVLALSYSGETEELLRILPTIKRLAGTFIALCSNPTCTLAQSADFFLDTSVDIEACPLNLAPTASTTVMLALGDALALELSRRKNWRAEDFADLHPGGRLGQRLARVGDIMHSGIAIPQVSATTPMPQVIYEMSRKKLGMTTVLSPEGHLLGIISDGDLRRLLERDIARDGARAILDHSAGDIMNPHPITIDATAFAAAALVLMEEKKITSLVVTTPDNHTQGVLHLHDIWAINLP